MSIPDINECEELNITCDQNAECTDIMGSYACVCHPGYTGNGISNCCKLSGHGYIRLCIQKMRQKLDFGVPGFIALKYFSTFCL